MIDPWIVAAALVAAGIVLGAVLGWFVRRRLIAARGGDVTSSIAGAAGLLVFATVALAGVLAAVATVEPETLQDIPRQLLDYTPRLLVAGIILLVGYAAGVAASRLVAFGAERATGRAAARVSAVVRWAIFGAAGLLALAQLGIDTTVLLVLVAIGGFGVALSAALLIGFGGRDIAREIAAGRYLGRHVGIGQILEWGDHGGRIVGLHPATAELETGDGGRRHVPYTQLLEKGVVVRSDDAQETMR